MSQHDMNIINASFPAVRADLNLALVALAENSRGATEPTTMFANQPWADTTSGIFKIRNDANTAWISVFYLATGKAVSNPNTTDTSGGVAGLTLFKINFKNALNTFTSFFTNSNTAARTYTFQDRDGTIADAADIALKANIASPTFTGTPAAPTAAADTSTTQIATTAFAKGEADAAQTAAITAAAAATATVYGIGSPILGRPADTTDYAAGSEIAGTSLYTCSSYNFRGSSSWSITPDPVLINMGNWRCTSRAYGNGSNGYAGVWVRIS